jgi:UDP-galactopyranose mutase
MPHSLNNVAIAFLTCDRAPNAYLTQSLKSLADSGALSRQLPIHLLIDGPSEDFVGAQPSYSHLQTHPLSEDRWAPVDGPMLKAPRFFHSLVRQQLLESCQHVEGISGWQIHRRIAYGYHRAFELAIENDYSGILICEDDVLFRPRFFDRFATALDEVISDGWETFLLSLYDPYHEDREQNPRFRRGKYYAHYPAEDCFGGQGVYFPRAVFKRAREFWKNRGWRRPAAEKTNDIILADFGGQVCTQGPRAGGIFVTYRSLVQHAGKHSSTASGSQYHYSNTFDKPWYDEDGSTLPQISVDLPDPPSSEPSRGRYDLLIVGAGISAATICAALKDRQRICVLDVRSHIAGNCYDYASCGSRIHQYGPHIFHSASRSVVEFLSKYTEWNQCSYSVEAEIEENNRLVQVPFPYSKRTAKVLGRSLTEDEVIEKFFSGYSRKMWGMDWDELPQSVKGRVPKDTKDEPDYFPGQFVGLPRLGYTHMIGNMLDGVEVVLAAGPNDWEQIRADKIIFTGRPDLIRVPGENASFGEVYDLILDYRSLDIAFRLEDWDSTAPCVNFCSMRSPSTRKMSYARLTGGKSRLVSYETPRAASCDDRAPYYPIPLAANIEKHKRLLQAIHSHHPSMLFCGRLGTYKYLDMFQAVGQALALVKEVFHA